MASSILLEGQVSGEGNETGWSGQWHFFRDNKIPLNFRYTRTSSDVPLDLIHYVSFIVNGNGDVSAKPRSRGRAKGWRKYSQSTTTPLAIDESAVKSEYFQSVGSMSIDPEDDSPRSANDGGATTPKGDSLKQGPVSVALTSDHPLFGLYVGSFDVKSQPGPVPIDETFFLHSFAGSSAPAISGLDVLPQTDWWVSSQLLKHMDLDAQHIFGETSKDRSISMDRSDEWVNQGPTEVKHERGETDIASTASAADGYGNTDGERLHITLPSTPESEKIDRSAPDSCTANTAAYPHLDFILGFGRNTYGRFSLFGVYNRNTGSLQCERKYLTGRTAGLRRNIRSGSISGFSIGGEDNNPSEPRMTTRPHRVPSFFLPEEVSVTPRSITSQEKKQRSMSMSASDDAPTPTNPTKRRRTATSGDIAAASAVTPTSQSSTTPGRARSSSTAGETTAALTLADKDFTDMSNNTVRYRPVYFDEETNSYYEGWWCSGYRNGRGICLYSDKLMYEGNWLMGRETGRGVLMTGNRQVLYRGDWVDGCFHGNGTYTFPNGDTYKGDWREGKRHGKGEYYMKKYGCTYKGDWKDNKRHGRGLFLWADGSTYDGDWEKDCRHGRGTLTLVNGFYYDGSWDRNFFDGRGFCVFPNGQEYQGMFKNGMRDGRGSVTFAEGAVYEGRFREDKMDGQGTCKISRVVLGPNEEWMIPIDIQADMRRIHYKAGFGEDAH